MPDDETPEITQGRKAAEKLVDDALLRFAETYDWTGVTTGWVLLVPYVGADGDGETSGQMMALSGGSMQWPLLIGTLRAACLRVEHDYVEEGRG